MHRKAADGLLENHLAFMAKHRGEVRRHPGAIQVESPSADFRCWMLEGPIEEPLHAPDVRQVRVLPWAGAVGPALGARGFRQKVVLRYMELSADPAPRPSPGFSISEAHEEPALRVFSEVQTRGFLTPKERFEPWFEFLHGWNQKNLGDPAQHFYVGALDGTPAAVTLLLVTGKVGGIYAVATLPDFRRRGLSRALLLRAIGEARAAGCERISLQVYAGSDAERLYLGLGFVPAFDCPIYVREA